MGIQPSRVKQIKQRKSYTVLHRAFIKLKKNNGDPLANLKVLYEVLDEYKAFGSRTNSALAHESLQLIQQEYGTTKA